MLRLSRYLSRRVWGSPTSTTAEKVEETIDPPPKTEAELEREAAERRENLKREAAAAKAEEAAKEVRRAEKAKAEEAKRVKLAAEAAAINALITKANKNKAVLAERRKSGKSLPPSAPSNPNDTNRTSSSIWSESTNRSNEPSFAYPSAPAPAAARGFAHTSREGAPPATAAFAGVQTTRGDWVPKQRPEVLITAIPQSNSATMSLPSVTSEAHAAQAAFGGPQRAELLLSPAVETLGEALKGRSTWLFAGHGDMLLAGEAVLGFHDAVSGDVQALSIDVLVAIVRPHVIHGRLKLVLLTGCRTLALAQALRERAYVPYVLCWETLLLDEAGEIFDKAFAEAITKGRSPQRAYERACLAVTTVTEPGKLDTGIPGMVQKYELHVDPMDRRLVDPRSGRMTGGKGRLAVGCPRLLVPDETKLNGVPALPLHYVSRPEQKELRAALLGGERCTPRSGRSGGRMFTAGGAFGASTSMDDSSRSAFGGLGLDLSSRLATPHDASHAFAGIAGAAGIGKTTLAAQLCHDVLVRTAFRDGLYWIDINRETDGNDALARLAKLLGMPHKEVDERRKRGGSDLSDEVARWLRGKNCLIVLDDVWDEIQPKPFRPLAGGSCVILLTTRRMPIVQSYGNLLGNVRPLESDAARRLLVATSGRTPADFALEAANYNYSDAKAIDSLIEMGAGLPAMLRSLGGMCRVRNPQSVLQFFRSHALSGRLPSTMARSEGYQIEAAKGNLFYALEEQVNALALEDALLVERLTMLAVFAHNVPVPLHVLMRLWGARNAPLNEAETREVVERLAREHLIELAAEPQQQARAASEETADACAAPQKQRPPTPGASSVFPPAVTEWLPGGGGGGTPFSLSASPMILGQQQQGMISDGESIEVIGPVGTYLRCRGFSQLGRLHAKLLEETRLFAMGDGHDGYWSARVLAHHLEGGRQLLRKGALSTVTLLNLANVSGVSMGDEGACALAACLMKGAMAELVELRLERNAIGDASVRMLATSVNASGALSKLSTLNMAHNNVTDKGFTTFAACTPALKALKVLDFSHNQINADGVRALLAAVARGGLALCSVLDLSSNQIPDASLMELAWSLKQPPAGTPLRPTVAPQPRPLPQLTSLALSDNPFGDVGVNALAEACAEGAISPDVIVLSAAPRQKLLEAINAKRNQGRVNKSPLGRRSQQTSLKDLGVESRRV